MGWSSRSWWAAAVLALLPLAHCWSSATPSNDIAAGVEADEARSQQKNDISPYVDLVLCPIRAEPWSCARQQSARILDVWDSELGSQWQKLKVEADRQLNSTLEKRGYSASEDLTKEKPSTILRKIEIGTKFMKEYLAETMDGFLGREYGYVQNTKQHSVVNEEDNDDGDGDDEEEEEENDDSADHAENESEDDAQAAAQSGDGDDDENDDGAKDTAVAAEASNVADTSNGIEFIEIEESAQSSGQLKKGSGGGGGFGGNKRKKKPTSVLVVQPIEQHGVQSGHGGGHGGGGHGGGGHGGRPLKQKQKRKKRKKHPPVEDVATVVIEQEPSNHLGLGLLDELVGAVDVGGGGGKRKHKPSKYGRSNGATRGKKKKKKKALQKLVLLGSFLKGKIELLLKILGAHLQIKFFAIALIGLLINIARFWIDVKRGGAPQKVVYVEHAHHQHHYEDHGGDDWGEQGSYWKRSLQTDPTVEEDGYAATDSYQPVPQSDAHYMAYRNQWH